jgi:predicted transcriptional regulator
MLESLGVSETEEGVYQILLEQPGASITSIAEASGVPRRQVGNVLASLEAKGLVTRTPDRLPKFIPTAPDAAIEVLVLQKQAELERTRLSAKGLVQKLKAARGADTTDHLIEVINGREAFARRFVQLQQSATDEVLAFDKPPYVTPARECNEVELSRLAGGLKWRGLYDRRALELPGALDVIRTMASAGEQARVMTGLPLKLAVADRRIGLIPLNVEPGREEAVIVHSSPLLDALVALFETLWERAAPIRFTNGPSETPGEGETSLSEMDGRILTLLAAGFTDESVANQVGVAQATVQRRMKRMMQTLGAQSRFQAGVLAAERGFLRSATPDP